MINLANDFEDFLREEERLKLPREQVKRLVNNYCRATGQPYSLVWRTLYLKLEARTGYRVRDDTKSMLQSIEDAGHIDALLREAKTLA